MLLTMACQSDFPTESLVSTGDGNVNFTVSAPEIMAESRAAFGEESNSALGGITNVDFSKFDLRYQLAVYRIDGGDYVEAISPQPKIVDSYEPVTYSLRLTANRNYQVVVWADFVPQGTQSDYYYDTSDFRDIKIPSTNKLSEYFNLESRDAYFITQNINVGNNGIAQDLILKRPFAKIRVITTDWNYENLEMPDNFKVSYYGCKRFVNIDAVTGVSSSDDLANTGNAIYTATINKDEKDYALNYDESTHNRTILVDYLMTDVEEQTPIHFTLEALDGTTRIAYHDLSTDIPIKRNWLTTIIGNALTTNAEFNISIDENFDNEWTMGQEWWNPVEITPTEPAYDATTNTYTISTREEFAWLPDHIETMVSAHPNFTLSIENDIDMSGIEWKPIYTKGENGYTVEGNGHTLRNFSMNGKFGAVYEYKLGPFVLGRYNAYTGVWGKFQGTMRNLTFENININGLADDEVHYDTEGNQIPHDAEYAYFAGCIGYTGQNWSTTAQYENVHARHVNIGASDKLTTQNIGGLIGWIGVGGGATWLKNCSAENIHITGYQAGGLVGQVLGSRYVGFTDCLAKDVYIRITSYPSSRNDISGFIGYINNGGNGNGTTGSNNIIITNCTPPTNVEYRNDKTDEVVDYTPDSPYYGSCGDNESGIFIDGSSVQP